MLDGIVLARELKVRSKCRNDVMSPIVEGIVPVTELVPITNFVMLWKYPISDGSDPDSLNEYRFIESTLA